MKQNNSEQAKNEKRMKWLLSYVLILTMAFTLFPWTGAQAHAASKKMALSCKTASLIIGAAKTIKVKNAPKKAKITYKSSKKSIASVTKKGKVKGLKAGTVKITALVKTGRATKKMTCKVTVRKPALSKTNLTLEEGQSSVLDIKNKPHKNAKAKYAWSSSNQSVVTTQGGKVTGVSEGTATISLKIQTNTKASYTLKTKVGVSRRDNRDHGDPPDERGKDDPNSSKEPTDSSGNENDEKPPETATQDLGELSVDISGVKVKTPEPAIFTLSIRKNPAKSDLPKLYKGAASLGDMHDDGKNGDAVASDGVYSLKASCYSSKETMESFKAVCGSSGSNTVSINYFDSITEQDLNVQAKYIAAFQELEAEHDAVDGDMDTAAVIEDIYQKTLQGQKDGSILSTEKNENGVLMQFASGIWYAYQPERDDVDASGEEASMSIMTLQPYNSEYDTFSKKESREATDDAAEKIAARLSDYTFDHNYDDGDVTLDAIKGLSAGQLTLLHTHGFYTEQTGPILWLGEKLTRSQVTSGGQYEADYLARRIVTTGDNRVGITSGFITKHCGWMFDSLLYLGACESGKDPRLAQSFLGKGAAAVIANSDTIWRKYNCDMMEDVANGLLTQDFTTKRYYTLKQAMAYAKEKHGENDYQWKPNNDHAPSTPTIFGDGDYRLSENTVTIPVESITLDQTNVSLKLGNQLSLRAEISPENADDKKITWSSDDSSIATVNQSGTVTSVGEGTATITATASNGLTASCEIQVFDEIINISTPTQLKNITNDLTAHYQLTQDINLSNAEWTPLGTSANAAFTGRLDGNGHKISGLKIANPTMDTLGLFGYLSGEVKNLTVEGSIAFTRNNASMYFYAGGIAGHGKNATVTNCDNRVVIQITASNDSQATYVYAGGIIGQADGGNVIEGCHNYADVTVASTMGTRTDAGAGGMAGWLTNGSSVKNCANEGAISTYTELGQSKYFSISSAGGLVGFGGVGVLITRCTNKGSVKAESYPAIKIEDFTNTVSAGGMIGSLTNGSVTDSENLSNDIVALGNENVVVAKGDLIGREY